MAPHQRDDVDRLKVDHLVDAVARLINAGGVEAVTMRRLAQDCGVGVTTLYGYVRTKDELLGLFADRLLGEIAAPDPGQLSGEQQIAYVFREAYKVLVEHPELAQIVGGQPLPGAAALRLFQHVLRVLVTHGLDDRQIQTAYAVLAAYTTGFVQQQAARNRRSPGLAELLASARANDSPAADGNGAGGEGDNNQLSEFDAGLAVVLAGIWGQAAANVGS
jgi:AcrR family transcriptional regulator